ncbi:D-alanyl-D-alanine carboxypeptidase family protein [Pelosinus sp. sgz500959]|uniref:M15 family metallopeptidase n=1 Tax=Pelosinus sp. sgz500959 TaxID=3242472 RepID=UPI00366ABF8E
MIIVKSNSMICIITVLCLASLGFNYFYGDLDIEKMFFGKSMPTAQMSSPQIPEVEHHKQSVILKDLPELKLVNKSIRLDKEYEPIDLVPVKGVYLREMAASALVKMLYAAESEGINDLVAYSGYRSYATQSAVYYNKIASLRPKYGELAEVEAAKLVAPPGASEHQTGLAADLTLKAFLDYEYVLNYDFADTIQGHWLKKNAWKYGFILRYAEDKEGKTNISYEPWHFRYVGLEHAKTIYERNICLEEYIDQSTTE